MDLLLKAAAIAAPFLVLGALVASVGDALLPTLGSRGHTGQAVAPA